MRSIEALLITCMLCLACFGRHDLFLFFFLFRSFSSLARPRLARPRLLLCVSAAAAAADDAAGAVARMPSSLQA